MSGRDHTRTERDAQLAAQHDVYQVNRADETDWQPGDVTEAGELGHAHGAGLVCLKCAMEASLAKYRAALATTDDEHDLCDDCQGLYDRDEGCAHGFSLCRQCLGRCSECRAEMREDSAVEAAAEAWGMRS